MADATGTTVWRWDQAEPFGSNPADENPSGLGAFDLPLRFLGQRHDKETGLHYNLARDYWPDGGRYVQSDPIGLQGGLNSYAYVYSSPLSGVDPLGLDVVSMYPMMDDLLNRRGSPGGGIACDVKKIECLSMCLLENQLICVPLGMGLGTLVGGTTAAVMACVNPPLAYPTFVLVNAGVGGTTTYVCNVEMRERCKEKCGGGPTSACKLR